MVWEYLRSPAKNLSFFAYLRLAMSIVRWACNLFTAKKSMVSNGFYIYIVVRWNCKLSSISIEIAGDFPATFDDVPWCFDFSGEIEPSMM